MARTYGLPDFRYVGLTAPRGRLLAQLAVGAATGAAVAGAVALVAGSMSRGLFVGAGAPSASLVSVGLLGAGAVIGLWHAEASRRQAAFPRDGARVLDVPMAIVPWGVVVSPDTEPRILRWPAVSSVTVEAVHSMRGGVPSVVASRVTVVTASGSFRGEAPGAVDLESLSANLGTYADEAARPLSADLAGGAALDEFALGDGVLGGHVVERLFEVAERALASALGAARLGLAAGTYRSGARLDGSAETVARLREALADDGLADRGGEPAGPHNDTPDRRPLAAALAGLVGASELVPRLLRLASSPHPILAAVARASAVRLGAPLARAGSVDELAGFLAEEDRALLEAFAEGAGRVSTVDLDAADETADAVELEDARSGNGVGETAPRSERDAVVEVGVDVDLDDEPRADVELAPAHA